MKVMLVKTLPNAFVETSIFSLIKLHLILLLFKASLIFHLYYNLYQRDTEKQIWINKNKKRLEIRRFFTDGKFHYDKVFNYFGMSHRRHIVES